MKEGWDRESRLFRLFWHNWWLVLVLAIGLGLYLQGRYEQQRRLSLLQGRVVMLESELRSARCRLEELKFWWERSDRIEAITELLREELGVVARGEVKVVWTDAQQSTSEAEQTDRVCVVPCR